MTRISNLPNRTSTLLSSQQSLNRLQVTQHDLARLQEQISTGQAIRRVSDDPAQVASILLLQRRLQEREQEGRNLDLATQTLNTADAALGEAANTLIEAKTIALSQIGVGSDADTRRAEAQVIDAQLTGLVDLANTQFNGVSVFGGNNGASLNGLVFDQFLGGVRYIGSDQNLQTDVGSFSSQDFTSQGGEAFGAFTATVNNAVDLDPQATTASRLEDIRGGTNHGFIPGSVELTVNAATFTVDLTAADTLEDIATLLTDAINNASAGAGSVAVTTTGFALTGNGANTVAIDDGPGIRTAASLGLDGLSSTGSTAAAGNDLDIQLTPLTTLASLNATVDLTSGIVVTQGEQSVTVDLSAATTIQDLQNIIADLDLGLRLDIADDGHSLDFVSTVAGLEFSVGENGGTTAADLGIRSFDTTTQLTDFRHGLGVLTQIGEDDLAVALHDGRSFTVNLDSATNVDEVVGLVNAAATAAGIANTDFQLGLASTGTGFVAVDNTTGANDFAITNANESNAAAHLGLVQNAAAGNTITGQDTATRRIDNAFTDLILLRDSLTKNDEFGIGIASNNLESDIDAVVSGRAIVGVQAQRLEDTQLRNQDQTLQEESLLSDLQDADLTEVISQYQQLQLQLQAALQTSAQIQQLNLLDFLR